MKALLLNPNAVYFEGYDEKRENYIEVQLLAYDRNKYVLLQLPDGTRDEFKSGYIRRIDNFGYLTTRQLYSLPVTEYTNDGIGIGKYRTKREVQKELRERYKLKTEFTVYFTDHPTKDATDKVLVGTLQKAIRVFRKHKYSQLLVSNGRWNQDGIAERDMKDGDVLYYDVNRRNNRPTYSAKALRELSK